MSAKVTPAAAAARPSAPSGPQPRAERGGRREETTPLNVPITATFIGLLLMREADWVAETAATPAAGEGGSRVDVPPAGGDIAEPGARPELGDGAELALDGGDRTAAAPGAAAATVTRFVQRGDAAAARVEGDVFQLGGEGRPVEVTLEGLQINGMPMALGAGGRPPAQAELASEEATHFDGAGYLAQIEDVQLGGDGDDTLTGTDGNDYISGNDGDDTISGNDGDDTLHGDAGDDTVDGGAGHDNVYGDAGDDDLDGGDGSDLVHGGTGDDTLQGGDAADWGFDNLYGGFGGDSYTVNHLSDVPDESWVVDAGVDTFRVTGAFIDDFTGAKPYFTAADSFGRLPGEVAAGDHVHVSTGIENVVLEGAWDADVYGGGGDNLLVGNAGANTIKGFAGADVLDGRGGENRLEGGRGADTYLVDTTLDGVATIVDGDGPGATTANTLRFKGVERADLAIARDGDVVTFGVDEVLRARIVDYDAAGPVFHVETDDARFALFDANHAPRLGAELVDEWAVAEGGVGQYGVPEDLFVDVDVDDALDLDARVDGGALPAWLSFDVEAGRFVAVPRPGDAGAYTVDVVATDGEGATARESFTLRVTDVNDAPEALWRNADVVFEEDAAAQQSYELATFFEDADGDEALTYAMTRADGTPLPAEVTDWLALDPATGRLTGFPEAPLDAPLELRVTARDDAGSEAAVRLTVGVEGSAAAPVANPDFGFGDEGGAIAGDVLANDGDGDGDGLTATLAAAPAHGAVELAANGAFVYTPEADFSGTDRFTYTVRDAAGAEAEAVAHLIVAPVNDAPAVDAPALAALDAEIAALALHEGQPEPASVRAEVFADADDAASALVYDATARDGGALPPWLGFEPAARTFTATPGHHDAGTAEVLLTARDPNGAQATVALSFEVAGANAAPTVGTPYEDATIAEGGALALDPGAHFADPDGDPLTLEVAADPSGGALPDWLVFDPAAERLSVSPGPEAASAGRTTVWVRAVDDAGATSAATSLVIDVEPLPDLLNTPAEEIRAYEDEALVGATLTGRFTDDPGAVLSASRADGGQLPDWLSFDAAAGRFAGTPGAADVGEVTVALRATDAAGHVDVESFQLIVENTNDPPVAVGALDDVEVVEGEPVAIALPTVETLFDDVDLAQGDELALSAPDKPVWLHFEPQSATFSAQAAPDVTADETSTITLVATDRGGATAELAFELTVEATNHAPEVAMMPFADTAIENQRYEWQLPAGTFDDPDLEDDQLDYAADTPDWLAFDPTNRTFTGRPGDADPGAYDVRVTATDASGASADTSIRFKVSNVNDAPTSAAEVGDRTVMEGAAIAAIDVADLFADADLGVDPDDTLSYAATSDDGGALPAGLVFDSAVLSGAPAEVGTHAIRLTTTDAYGRTADQTFDLTVTPRSGAEDVVLDPGGAIPTSAMPESGSASENFFVFRDRYYKLSSEAAPAEYQDDLSALPWPVDLSYDSVNHYELTSIHTTGGNTKAILGNENANVLLGNNADDILIGQAGNDVLSGAAGADTLYGGTGDDVLAGGTGSNELHGGAGDDRYEIGAHGEAGLREGDLDTIFDADGANIIDMDGVTADRMSFGMDGADLVVAVDGAPASKIAGFDGTDATFEVQAEDGSWDHAALLAAVEEVRAQTTSVAAEPASFKADVLDGFLDDDAAAPRSSDPLAAFTPDRGEVDDAPPDGRGGASTPADEPVGTFVAPEEGATTTAAAAGLATKTALEEDPAYA